MIILAGFLIILVAVFVVALRVMKVNEVEQENRMLQAYMDSMQEFYAAIQNRIEATRRYRHDLAKHIRTLENLLSENEPAMDMQEYMEDLKGRYYQLKHEEYCTDEIVNAVLSIKKQQCKEKEIPVEIEVGEIDYGVIEEIDKAALLHNLLDNAIEANERIARGCRKGIRFAMEQRGRKLWIDVENCISPGEQVNFKTRKAIKEEHGIGTMIIDNLIQKYGGRKEIVPGQETFRQKVYLLTGDVAGRAMEGAGKDGQ